MTSRTVFFTSTRIKCLFLLLEPPCLRVQNGTAPTSVPSARAQERASIKLVRGKLLLRAVA